VSVLDFRTGDFVRVKTARRRDVSFEVLEIAPDGRVRARREGQHGGEACYPAESFERIAPPAPPPSEESSAQPIATSTATAEPVAPLRAVTENSTAGGPYTKQRVPFDASVECRDSTIVRPRDGENLESLLKRFKKAMSASGILAEYRARQHFIPKPQRRRQKSATARARRAKAGIA
jgi:small subunit ribosomal protein S21